jgi:hypothetical protein
VAACVSDFRRLLVPIGLALVLGGCGAGSQQQDLDAPVTLAAGSPTPVAPSIEPLPADGVSVADDDALPRGARTVIDESADLDVEDQFGDGRQVRLDGVRAGSAAGFVAVYDAGWTRLGTTSVAPGVQAVTLTLTKPVRSSQELLAVLHRDDGDGTFDVATDPVVVADAEPVAEDFDDVLD